MKYFIYSVTVLLLLQGCGGDSVADTNTTTSNLSGNGEDLNAEPTTSTEPTPTEATPTEATPTTESTEPSTSTEPTADTTEARFIDLPINPTFSREGNIVIEDQSNLYWQDNREAQTTRKKFAEAESYCASLTLDEIDSWRLPTYNELLTIVDYGTYRPAVHAIFSNTNSKQYWTQTKQAKNEDFYRWLIHFDRGHVHYNLGTYIAGRSSTHNVRCVSDEFANKRLKERDFSKSEDVVTDNINRLLWQDTLNTKIDRYAFSEADAYCDNLSLGGLTSGWRVPTVKELSSLIKIDSHSPAMDDTFTSTAYNDAYWALENQANDSDLGSSLFHWDVNFKDGVISTGGTNSASFDQYVRCVRDSGK